MFGDFMCKLVSTITLMHMYLGNLLVSIMAVDRVMAFVFYKQVGFMRFVHFIWVKYNFYDVFCINYCFKINTNH